MAIHDLKKYFFKASRRTVAGLLLAIITITPAFAADYEILTSEGGGVVTGVSSITGTIGAPGPTAVTYSTNLTSSIAVQTFTGSLTIQFLDVNYSDGKTPENNIVGTFAEGLTGTLRTAEAPNGRYEITFDPTTAPTNPAGPVKICSIQQFDNQGNATGSPIPCEYSLTNTANATGSISVPEPSTLMLITIGLLSCWLVVRRRRRAA